VSSQITSQFKSFTLSRQTTWTGFNPYLYSGWSPSADSAQVENSNGKVPYIPQQPDGVNALHTILVLGRWQTLCQSQCPCWV